MLNVYFEWRIAAALTCIVCIFFFPFSRIRIQAINEIGAGPFSQFIKAKTRPLPPLPPRLECAAAGPQSLKLKWGDSNSKTHAADDMVYTLQLEDRNKRWGGGEDAPEASVALACGMKSQLYIFICLH